LRPATKRGGKNQGFYADHRKGWPPDKEKRKKKLAPHLLGAGEKRKDAAFFVCERPEKEKRKIFSAIGPPADVAQEGGKEGIQKKRSPT